MLAQLLIRNLEDDVKRRLRERARRHGRSAEEEAREILRTAVMAPDEQPEPLGRRLRQLFEGIGIDADIPELRGHPASPAESSERSIFCAELS